MTEIYTSAVTGACLRRQKGCKTERGKNWRRKRRQAYKKNQALSLCSVDGKYFALYYWTLNWTWHVIRRDEYWRSHIYRIFTKSKVKSFDSVNEVSYFPMDGTLYSVPYCRSTEELFYYHKKSKLVILDRFKQATRMRLGKVKSNSIRVAWFEWLGFNTRSLNPRKWRQPNPSGKKSTTF